MENRSKILFAATSLATIYAVYLIKYFFDSITGTTGFEMIGGAVAAALAAPHIILFVIGAVFGWIGVLSRKDWGALVGAILYSAGTLFFLLYAVFVVPIIILGLIGYAKQKKNKSILALKRYMYFSK